MITAQTAMQIYKLYSNMSYHYSTIYTFNHPSHLFCRDNEPINRVSFIVSVLRFAILKIIFNFVFVNIINS